ncbi:hypothetical protein [Prescottella equi]
MDESSVIPGRLQASFVPTLAGLAWLAVEPSSPPTKLASIIADEVWYSRGLLQVLPSRVRHLGGVGEDGDSVAFMERDNVP